MISNIQFIKMKSSEELTFKVKEQLEKLAAKYEWIIKAEVFFKLENTAGGKLKICEIELSAPGPRIFAASKAEKFAPAISETIAELEQQLKKRKAVFQAY